MSRFYEQEPGRRHLTTSEQNREDEEKALRRQIDRELDEDAAYRGSGPTRRERDDYTQRRLHEEERERNEDAGWRD